LVLFYFIFGSFLFYFCLMVIIYFFLQIYVANVGDSRAVLVSQWENSKKEFIPIRTSKKNHSSDGGAMFCCKSTSEKKEESPPNIDEPGPTEFLRPPLFPLVESYSLLPFTLNEDSSNESKSKKDRNTVKNNTAGLTFFSQTPKYSNIFLSGRALTNDHKPFFPSELGYIKSVGGWVSTERRVNGMFACFALNVIHMCLYFQRGSGYIA
jgi:hypothetical protein